VEDAEPDSDEACSTNADTAEDRARTARENQAEKRATKKSKRVPMATLAKYVGPVPVLHFDGTWGGRNT
jgi:hypothetical protein